MAEHEDEFAPLRCAYGDSPYLGCCKLYGHVHDGPRPELYGCWDELDTWKRYIAWLDDEFPDGWALSCNSTELVSAGMLTLVEGCKRPGSSHRDQQVYALTTAGRRWDAMRNAS